MIKVHIHIYSENGNYMDYRVSQVVKLNVVPRIGETFFMDEEMCCNLEKQAMENNLQYAYKEYLYLKDRLTYEDCIKVKDVCHYSNGEIHIELCRP